LFEQLLKSTNHDREGLLRISNLLRDYRSTITYIAHSKKLIYDTLPLYSSIGLFYRLTIIRINNYA
jgi:hypothetical protein